MLSKEEFDLIINNIIENLNFEILSKDQLENIYYNSLYQKDELSQIISIFYDIITLHPLVDGNKRTAVLFLIEALRYLGKKLNLNKREIYLLTISILIDNLSKKDVIDVLSKFITPFREK